MKLYEQLAEWWPLISPREDYAVEAARYWKLMSGWARRPIRSVLELGSGGGHAASHLKAHASMTLVDLSEPMLRVSRGLNPECEHVNGDMRTVRLAREFDAVFVHDAVMHMLGRDQVVAAMRTARAHCAAGGIALFVPDSTRERWSSETRAGGRDESEGRASGRGARYLSWTWDPDPGDGEFMLELACVLRDGDGRVRVEHDRARMGLFAHAEWLAMLKEAGFADVRADSGAGPDEPTVFGGMG